MLNVILVDNECSVALKVWLRQTVSSLCWAHCVLSESCCSSDSIKALTIINNGFSFLSSRHKLLMSNVIGLNLLLSSLLTLSLNQWGNCFFVSDMKTAIIPQNGSSLPVSPRPWASLGAEPCWDKLLQYFKWVSNTLLCELGAYLDLHHEAGQLLIEILLTHFLTYKMQSN